MDSSDLPRLLSGIAQSARQGQFAQAVEHIKQVLTLGGAELPELSNLADLLKRGADLENVSRLAPRRINALLTSGWLTSLLTGRPVNAQGQPIPWFTYPAIDFLEPRIGDQWQVLEWGCGNSTLWWAGRVRQVISVEHDPRWHESIAARIPANASVKLLENPNDYVNLTGVERPETFDAIVIDGEHRNRCAEKAAACANPASIIVFDNSDRAANRDGLQHLMTAGFKRIDFFGLIPGYLYRACTSIFYRDESFLTPPTLPCDHRSSIGPTLSQILSE